MGRTRWKPPPPMTGEGCEALNIFILYLALSKVQPHVGINILHGAPIKLPPEPMISVIFEYMLSTPASMPFRTWYQTILPILLIFGIFEYLPSQTIFSSSLEPATNERPEKLVNTELCPLLNKGLSSVVDNYSTQPFPYYELYNVIQMVEMNVTEQSSSAGPGMCQMCQRDVSRWFRSRSLLCGSCYVCQIKTSTALLPTL